MLARETKSFNANVTKCTLTAVVYLLHGDDQHVDVRNLVGQSEVAALPFGHGSLVKHVERKLVAEILYDLDSARESVSV